MTTTSDAPSTAAARSEAPPPAALSAGSLAELFDKHPERRYVMFGGKGGLGKTTFSAATGYWLARQGKKVLVFSVDPQASLSDIFQQDIFGKGPVRIMDNLWAQEIDADRHIREYQDEIRQKIRDMYGLDEVPQEIEDYIQAASAEPAMEESAIFDSVVDIVVQGDYDYYIYDLVPLGHALYYLSMAKVYDEWITKITRLREEMREYEEVAARMKRQKEVDEDEILGELQYIRGRINSASKILTDREKTAFFFVLVPEQMILLDTRKAAELFARFDVPIGGYVVNRVLPEELRTQNVPAYLRNRMEMQRGELDEIRQTFGKQVLAYVPELERDVTGLPMIERVAELMYGSGSTSAGPPS
jgi:arsenite-transporting ATPase